MGLYRYTVRRLVQIIPVMLGVFTLTFVMMHALPGNPVDIYLGQNPDQQVRQAIMDQYGFNQPLWKQYIDYFVRLMQGNLGRSFLYKEPVSSLMLNRLGPTVTLMGLSYLIALPVAIGMGIFAAARHNESGDHVSRFLGLAGVSTPNFWLGLMLIFAFAYTYQYFPASGYVLFTEDPVRAVKHLTLPVLTLATAQTATLMRMTRSSMIEELGEGYVETMRAYGIPERKVLIKHAFRNAMLPLVTIIGLQISFLFDGAVVIEKIFAIPGMGRLFFKGITNHDYGIVMGGTIVFAIIFLIGVLITDLAYAYIDPRIRYD